MESIDRFVTEQLAAWEVPGCAAAAVRDGQVVLAAGWGRRDLDAKLPVTADTLFAIGSTTKAFTAATVGALVDDGLLEWDRPLRDYVPELRLHDAVVTDRLTVVDLLSHRSGLPRHEMVWLGHPRQHESHIVLPEDRTAMRPNTAAHRSSGSARTRRRIVGTPCMTSPSCRIAPYGGLNGRRRSDMNEVRHPSRAAHHMTRCHARLGPRVLARGRGAGRAAGARRRGGPVPSGAGPGRAALDAGRGGRPDPARAG